MLYELLASNKLGLTSYLTFNRIASEFPTESSVRVIFSGSKALDHLQVISVWFSGLKGLVMVRNSRCAFSAFAVTSLLFAATASAKAQGLPLADLIRETKVALLRVQEKAEAQRLPPLKNATLEVNTTQEISGDGSVKFLVVELGAGPSVGSTSTVKITLEPPPPGAGINIANVQLADKLAEGILSAARSLAEAEQGQPPLIVSAVTVAIKFAVKRSASGGLALEFPPFKLNAKAGNQSSDIQVITVTYGVDNPK